MPKKKRKKGNVETKMVHTNVTTMTKMQEKPSRGRTRIGKAVSGTVSYLKERDDLWMVQKKTHL